MEKELHQKKVDNDISLRPDRHLGKRKKRRPWWNGLIQRTIQSQVKQSKCAYVEMTEGANEKDKNQTWITHWCHVKQISELLWYLRQTSKFKDCYWFKLCESAQWNKGSLSTDKPVILLQLAGSHLNISSEVHCVILYLWPILRVVKSFIWVIIDFSL